MEHFDIKQVYNNYIKLNKAQRKSVLRQLQKEGIPVKAIEAYTYPEAPGLVHLFCKRPILTYPTGKAPLGSFPLKVFKNRT